MMDYPYGMYGDCSFSRFGSIVQTDRQSDTNTHARAHMNALLLRLSSAWIMKLSLCNCKRNTYIRRLPETERIPAEKRLSSSTCVWSCSQLTTGNIAWHSTTCPCRVSSDTALNFLSLAIFQTRSCLWRSTECCHTAIISIRSDQFKNRVFQSMNVSMGRWLAFSCDKNQTNRIYFQYIVQNFKFLYLLTYYINFVDKSRFIIAIKWHKWSKI